MCSIVILRKRLLQTCMMSIHDENFVFTKVPCVVFGGPSPQCLSEDVFYFILDQQEKVVLAPAVSAMVDESSANLVRELMESKTDDQLEELNRINSDWLLEQGISTYTVLCKSNANDNRRISRYIGDI